MTKPGIEEKSQFALCVVVGLRLYFKFLPQLQIHDLDFRKGIAIRTLKLCRILAKFEDLCLIHFSE